LILKKTLIATKSFCDKHGQRVVGFGSIGSLLKAHGLANWMSNSFCQKDHEKHIEKYVRWDICCF
jgi:hypothetical protein